jgi:hypothetical protein
MGKRIARRNCERQTFGSGCDRSARTGDGDPRADSYSRSLDTLRVHPDCIFIVIRGVPVRNSGVRQRMSGVAASVRLHMPVDNRVRVISISLVRVEHRRETSRYERGNDEAGEERTPREAHV